MDRLCFFIKRPEDLKEARYAARELARKVGFSTFDCTIIATVVSELARNILTHVGSGRMTLAVVNEGGISVLAEDQGPGIADPSWVLQPGHGLWAVRQGMDELVIEVGDADRGTRVKTAKRLRGRGGPDRSNPLVSSA